MQRYYIFVKNKARCFVLVDPLAILAAPDLCHIPQAKKSLVSIHKKGAVTIPDV